MYVHLYVYFKELVVDVDWFHLAQYRLVWRAVMNTVKNPRVSCFYYSSTLTMEVVRSFEASIDFIRL
jgi:hypothetical protein